MYVRISCVYKKGTSVYVYVCVYVQYMYCIVYVLLMCVVFIRKGHLCMYVYVRMCVRTVHVLHSIHVTYVCCV